MNENGGSALPVSVPFCYIDLWESVVRSREQQQHP
jgi:hypothetical protein